MSVHDSTKWNNDARDPESRPMIQFGKRLMVGLAVMFCASSLAAAPVYIHTYSTGADSRLWTADSDGGSATPAPESFGVDWITDLAMSCDGTIYASDFERLYRIDPTGVALPVHSENPHNLRVVGLDFAADGTLFGITEIGQLAAFDLITGSVMAVFQTQVSYWGDLAYAGMDGEEYQFYASSNGGRLVAIRASLDDPDGVSAIEFTTPIADGQNFAALDFAGETLIAIGDLGAIYEIDTTTGIGALAGNITGPSGFGGLTSATQATVRLAIRREGSHVVLSWPAAFLNYTLEWTDTLPSSNWLPELTSPTVLDDQALVTLEISHPRRFFRLRCGGE